MYLTIKDEEYLKDHVVILHNYMYRYYNLSGNHWPPFNYNQKEFPHLPDWFAALKDAVEKLEKEQQSRPED